MGNTGTIMEIERKWVLKKLPPALGLYEAWEVNYAYTNEGHRYQEIINTKDSNDRRYTMVHKIGEGLTRKETTIPISEEDYIEQATSTETVKIHKTSFMIPFEGGNLEIDKYHNLSLVTMEYEIELAVGTPKLDELAESFRIKELDLPEGIKNCIIKEVTGESEYSNLNLAIKSTY